MQCSELRENGDKFLSALLPPKQSDAMISHLDECHDCRHWLESQNASSESWQQAREWLRQGGDIVTLKSAEQEDATLGFDTDELDKRFRTALAPSDELHSIGRIGNLEITGLLGSGGAGIVYKAIDPALGRKVAVKILDPTCRNQESARVRFAREARAMAAISHEHVVPVYAVSEHQGMPFFVMEYVTGGTLAQRLQNEGPLGIIETIRVGIQIAKGLAAAHRQGVVHRDVKPSNILLDPGVERVRVADFGLARASTDQTQTETGSLVGTPHYMSPEQVRCDEIDARSDLFSLGSVLYTTCTGNTPFTAETVYRLMHKITNDQPVPPSDWNPEIPEWLDAIILNLLSKSPGDRFADAATLVEILESELAHLQQPELLPPDRRWMPAPVSKPLEWRKLAVTMLLAFVVFVGLSCFVWPPQNWLGSMLSQKQEARNYPDEQLELPESLQPWADQILAQTNHQPIAFSIGPKMIAELEPAESLEVAHAVWPAVGVPNVRTGLLKAFYFQQHPNLLNVLHLGAIDDSPAVQKYAKLYIKQISFRTFELNPDEYERWYADNKDALLDDVFRESYNSLADRLRDTNIELGFRLLREFRVDFGGGGNMTAFPAEREAAQSTDIGKTIFAWIHENKSRAEYEHRLADLISRFPFTQEQLDSELLPLLDESNSDVSMVLQTTIAVVAEQSDRARDMLLMKLSQTGNSNSNSPETRLNQITIANQLAELGDPQTIAPMIDLMTETTNERLRIALNSALCNGKLLSLTNVKHNEFAGPLWWHRWWRENHHRLPEPANSMRLKSKIVETGDGSDALVDFETHQGQLQILKDEFEKMRRGGRHKLTAAASNFAKAGDPRSIPILIGAIDADNSYDTIYGIGYFGLSQDALGKLTEVSYDSTHDGAWWRRWWKENKHRFGDDIASIPIADFAKTKHGRIYTPLPANLDSHQGRVAYLQQQLKSGEADLHELAKLFGNVDDSRGIPVLIGLIATWPDQKVNYDVGYFGLGQGALGKMTDVKYDESHDALWWQAWWLNNRHHFPDAKDMDVPKYSVQADD